MSDEVIVKTWGNSLAVRLPRKLAGSLGLADGSALEISVADGSLRLTPTRRKPTLDELLANEPGPRTGAREIDWGGKRGSEEW